MEWRGGRRDGARNGTERPRAADREEYRRWAEVGGEGLEEVFVGRIALVVKKTEEKGCSFASRNEK